ncbi:hypothetical protein M569_07569, partial [Genlisea aurea]
LQNPRLFDAFLAFQSWKLAITDDPKGFTSNWVGHDVCNYRGVYCAPAPDDPGVITVAGVDLNHADVAGVLPEELGLLCDVALFHLNSNRFQGSLPAEFCKLKLLFELDLSNNLFCGGFPAVVFKLPSLKFLDLRFNKFVGDVPPEVFDLQLDALFLNDNAFKLTLPPNLGNSPVSVLVAANIFGFGILPPAVGQMAETLNEIVLLNSGLLGSLPDEIGQLTKLTVFDVGFNHLIGTLPESIGKMVSLEQLNVAHNKLTGNIPEGICLLPRLQNFTYSDNYFCSVPRSCQNLSPDDGDENCIPCKADQRSPLEC